MIPFIITQQLIQSYKTKNIDHHINVVIKPPRTQFIFFTEIFLNIVKLYIFIVAVNIGYIYVIFHIVDLSTLTLS